MSPQVKKILSEGIERYEDYQRLKQLEEALKQHPEWIKQDPQLAKWIQPGSWSGVKLES